MPSETLSTGAPLRIAYIAAGAGGMFCGACLHDNTLAAALQRLGEDVVLLPTYTPLRTDEVNVSEKRVFLGGINVYLGQKLALFRHSPAWLHRLLDHPRLLGWVGGRASSVDPARLGDMTVSVLEGPRGNQAREVAELIDWLADEFRPDAVHLSNSMLSGLAAPIRQRLGVPVICSLAGEDIFLEHLVPPHYEAARELLRQNAREIDAFVALNEYYADYMATYLDVDRSRVAVVPHGLELEGHSMRTRSEEPRPLRIGYLARICEEKGLHVLIEACQELATSGQLGPIELHAAGYLGPGERKYLAQLQAQARRGILGRRFYYHGELTREEKIAFLQSLDVFALPTVYVESKGLPALEALANGIPVVVPDHGCFPELIRDTGGGLLCRPRDPVDLAEKIATLLAAPDRGQSYGHRGYAAIHDRYHADAMAEKTRQFYRRRQILMG